MPKKSSKQTLFSTKQKTDIELITGQQAKTIYLAGIYCFGQQSRCFYYSFDAGLKDKIIGSLVKVGFGNKILFGIVLEIQEAQLQDGNVSFRECELPYEKLKPISEIIEPQLLSENFLQFIDKMAFYNVIDKERLLQLVIPNCWMNKKRALAEIKPDKKRQEMIANAEQITLSEEQQAVADAIKLDGFNVSVLQGIMGSGKTFVFLELVKKVLQQDATAQVLLMVPEIALTNQLIETVCKVCGYEPLIWHSSVTAANKKKYYEAIIRGTARIVISARSGLLLPYKNLRLIVIDEEHDLSYKQDEVPVYHARDMAILRAKYETLPVILSSATPSIETLANVISDKYQLFKLKTQFFHSNPPEIRLIPNALGGKAGCISAEARELIRETVKKGEQAMIFINRRGYSRTLQCKDCGFEAKCENCDNLLAYHRKRGELKCHYCGYIMRDVFACQECGSKHLEPNKGVGVEQLQQEINDWIEKSGLEKEMERKVNTLLFSSDEITKEGDIEQLSAEIQQGDVDIIIGTQIMSKGHHFPRLTAIIVLDIDRMTVDGDFRAYERMFQLLFQLSGRAGRELSGAKVLIQTSNNSNPVLQNIKNHDMKMFYKEEIQQRKKFNLPPYARFISIIVAAEVEEHARQYADFIGQKLKEFLPQNAKLLGPRESTMHYLKRSYRYSFLIEADKNMNVISALNKFRKSIEVPRNIQLKVDVDCYSFG
ncbi:MAG: primosomal protein N' [Rickettsiales bacterium]|nr:primosomal protein N' [Rickettsiales bacterium]